MAGVDNGGRNAFDSRFCMKGIQTGFDLSVQICNNDIIPKGISKF